jgi:hypothetical protein
MCVDTLRPFCYSICFSYCTDGSIRGFIQPQPGRIQEKSKGDMTTSNEYARFRKAPIIWREKLDRHAECGEYWWRFPAMILLLLGLVFASAGCGGGGGGTGIVLEVQPNIAQTMDEGEQQVFTAFVAPDPNKKGVTWSLSGTGCAGDGCGKLSATMGSPITYTAPSGLAANLVVTLKCVANVNNNTTQSVTITVVLPPKFATTPVPPNGSNGVPYNFQIVVTGGVPPLTFSLKSGSLPEGLTLNQTGSIVGRPTGPVPGHNPALFTVQVADNVTTPTPVISPQFSISISSPPPLTITSSGALSPATLNSAYSTRINTTGGVQPFRWSVPPNTLPPGLSLDPVSGVISGTPTQASTFQFTPTVMDSAIPPQIVSTPSPLSITVSPPSPLVITNPSPSLTPGQTLVPYSAAITVSGGVAPYAWSVRAGQLPSGLTLNPSTGQISGTPVLVTTSDFTIQVTDSETAPPQTKTAPFTIDVTIGPDNPNNLLKGSYAFLFKGFDAQGPVLMAGVFLANGSGSITSGSEDVNRLTSLNRVTSAATLSGTYAIGSDGRGTMTLTATDKHLATVTSAYQLVFDSNGNARFFENDSTNPTPPPFPTHGSGIIKLQLGTNFGAGNLSGNYAFAFSGRDLNGTPSALAGFVHADGAQTLSPGLVDFNDAGTFHPQNQLSGNFAVTSAAGRGAAVFDFAPVGSPQVSLQYAFYFVSPTDLFLVSSDITDATHPLLAGEMILQDPSVKFDQTVLSGPSTATGTGLDTNASAFVGRLLTADPTCAGPFAVSLVFNQNDSGVISAPAPLCGTYSVNTDGHVSFTNLGSRVAGAYLTGKNQGFLIGSDTAATSGQIEPQTGAPFSLTSVQGGYTLSAPITAEKNVKNLLGQLSCLKGDGIMTGIVDEIDADGTAHPNQSATLTFTLTDATRGRGTVTTTTNSAVLPTNLAFYIVSPSKIRLISTDNGDQHPQVIFLDH